MTSNIEKINKIILTQQRQRQQRQRQRQRQQQGLLFFRQTGIKFDYQNFIIRRQPFIPIIKVSICFLATRVKLFSLLQYLLLPLPNIFEYCLSFLAEQNTADNNYKKMH